MVTLAALFIYFIYILPFSQRGAETAYVVLLSLLLPHNKPDSV